MEQIRVLVADDHALMREGTRHLLEEHPDILVVGEAEDGQEALDLIEQLKPDVAVIDIRLPRLSGIDVVRQMRERAPGTAALILTAYDDDDYILALMDAGAQGYLLKTGRSGELVDAVHKVMQGEPVLDSAIVGKVARLLAQQRDADQHEDPRQLSPRQLSVLELAAQGLRNKAIAEKLNISVRTVDGHSRAILSKLGVSSRMEAVLYAISHGLVTPSDGGTAR